MLKNFVLTLAMMLVVLVATSTASADVDCSLLDPRESVSTVKEGKIAASVNTLFKIAKAGGDVEGKVRSEITNLQKGVPVKEKSLIELRTLYLFCGMVANAKDITTDRKVEIFNLMMKAKDTRRNGDDENIKPPFSELASALRRNKYELGWSGALLGTVDAAFTSAKIESVQFQRKNYVILKYSRADGPGEVRATIGSRTLTGMWRDADGEGDLDLLFNDSLSRATGWWNRGGHTQKYNVFMKRLE